MIWIKNYIKYK